MRARIPPETPETGDFNRTTPQHLIAEDQPQVEVVPGPRGCYRCSLFVRVYLDFHTESGELSQ